MTTNKLQKILLPKTFSFKRYGLSKTLTLKHFLCGRGFARDVHGGTRGTLTQLIQCGGLSKAVALWSRDVLAAGCSSILQGWIASLWLSCCK